jgi:hypothetical protein
MPNRLEHFMARLFTDRTFREAFLADPAGIGAREGLSGDECRAVMAMPAADVATAGRSYAAKRGEGKPRRTPWLRRVFGRASQSTRVP